MKVEQRSVPVRDLVDGYSDGRGRRPPLSYSHGIWR